MMGERVRWRITVHASPRNDEEPRGHADEPRLKGSPTTVVRAWRWLTGETWVFDPIGAGARVPAIALCLGVGIASEHALVGVVAAGGAYTVGFGAPLDLRGSRSLVLVAASAGIGVSTMLGSLAARSTPVAVALLALAGFLCGRAASRGAAFAWIALQCALAAVIATSYPAPLERAALRALIILGGGLLQTGVLALARFARRRLPPTPPPDPFVPHYAIHLLVALAAAALVGRALGLRNGYWAPMTALLVLRPDRAHTMTRVVTRVAGTVGGAALASAALLSVHPQPVTLAVGVSVAAFFSYLFQKASYGLLSACVTVYVVFILSLAGLPEEQVALSRILVTIVGGSIAVAVQLGDWRTWRPRAPSGSGSPDS
jgi:hypothetical protein